MKSSFLLLVFVRHVESDLLQSPKDCSDGFKPSCGRQSTHDVGMQHSLLMFSFYLVRVLHSSCAMSRMVIALVSLAVRIGFLPKRSFLWWSESCGLQQLQSISSHECRCDR